MKIYSHNLPTNKPTSQPASHPTNQPTSQPANQPTSQAPNHPTNQPVSQATNQPANHPTSQPANQPTYSTNQNDPTALNRGRALRESCRWSTSRASRRAARACSGRLGFWGLPRRLSEAQTAVFEVARFIFEVTFVYLKRTNWTFVHSTHHKKKKKEKPRLTWNPTFGGVLVWTIFP